MQPSAAALAESHQQQARQRQQQRQADEQQQAAQEGTHNDSAASILAASTVAVTQQSLAQRCHTDGLHSIFQYLALRELLPALRSCRQWCAAAYKEKSRAISFEIKPRHISLISASPLVHHIATCRVSSGPDPDFSPAHLQLLREWPRLTDLTLGVDIAPMLDGLIRHQLSYPAAVEELTRVFPRQLQRLSMWSPYGAASSTAAQQLLIDVVGGCTHLRTLRMRLDDAASGSLHLLSLHHVTDLSLVGVELTLPVVQELRQLRSLEVLDINSGADWTPELLADLCATPVTLTKLRELTLPDTLSASHMRELTRLPALDTLDAAFQLDSLPLLKEFPSLATLRVCVHGDGVVDPCPASRIVPHLAEYRGLTDLTLICCTFREDDIRALVAATPLLTSLKLDYCPDLPSLSSLSAASHLHSLTLHRCAGFDMAGLLSIRVPSLRRLNIHLALETPGQAALLRAIRWEIATSSQFAALNKRSSCIS